MPHADPTPRPATPGPGGPLILLILAGTIAGVALGQPTIGFLAGLALGSAAALFLWWRSRA